MAVTARSWDEILAMTLKFDDEHAAQLRKEAKGIEVPRLLSSVDVQQQEPPTWYMEKLLQEDSLTFMYGPPKVGKSFLALDWAFCLATGTQWMEYRTIPIRVLYCSAEGNRSMGERIKALLKAKGYPSDPARLRFLPGVRQLFWRTPGKPLALLELIVAIDEFRPHLVILDTLARHCPGADVAANVDMSKVVYMLDELRETFGCSFLVVHHSRKDGGDYLGATHLFGAADAMIEVEQRGGGESSGPKGFVLRTVSKDLEDYTLPYMFAVVGVSEAPGWGVVESTNAVTGGVRMNEVYEYLRIEGPSTASEISEAVWGNKTPVDTNAARNVLARLAERSLAEEVGPGKPKRWRAVEQTESL